MNKNEVKLLNNNELDDLDFFELCQYLELLNNVDNESTEK